LKKKINRKRLYTRRINSPSDKVKRAVFTLRTKHTSINKLYKMLMAINKDTKTFMDMLYKHDQEGDYFQIIDTHASEIPKRLRPIVFDGKFSVQQQNKSLEEMFRELSFHLGKEFESYTKYAINKFNGTLQGIDSVIIEINGTQFRTVNSRSNIESIIEQINSTGFVVKDECRNIHHPFNATPLL
jgi:hypothetical protein